MMKEHKKIIAVILLFILVGGISIGGYLYKVEKENQEIERQQRAKIIHYSSYMGMFSQDILLIRGTDSDDYLSGENGEKEIRILLEAPVKPDQNYITIYPYHDTFVYLHNLNKEIEEGYINLDEYDLTYPVTMNDLVEKWEEVYKLVFEDIDSFITEIVLGSVLGANSTLNAEKKYQAELLGMESKDIQLYKGSGYEEILNDENREKEIHFVSEITEENENNDIITIYPTQKTEEYLKNLNEYINSENIDVSSHNLEYPITIDHVLDDRERFSICFFLDFDISTEDKNQILT